MGEVLTLLARDPSNGANPAPGDDGNIAIDLVGKLIPDHRPVASVQEIARELRSLRDRPQPRLIQIIGHGAPGVLSLGYHWTRKYTESPTGPYYVLDSNPYAYGVLARWVRPPTEVWLIGCRVGADGPDGTVVTGRTLLFDLEQMWRGCRVYAAADLVGPADFMNTRFIGRLVGSDGAPRPVDRLPLAPAPGQPCVRGIQPAPAAEEGVFDCIQFPSIAFDELIAVPLPWAMCGAHARPFSCDECGRLTREFTTEVSLPPLLALPEMQYALSRAPGVCAELVANGRYVRVHDGTRTRYFRAAVHG